MARLTTVMADYFRSRLNGLSGMVGLAIGVSRSPELTTTTHRLTRRLSVEVLLGTLGVSVGCVLVTELVAFAMSTDSNEGLRQVSGLLGGLWVVFFNPHPQLWVQYMEKLLQNDCISDLLFSLLHGAHPLSVKVVRLD